MTPCRTSRRLPPALAVLALLVTGACGGPSSAEEDGGVGDVRGTPFRRAKAETPPPPTAPDATALGDVDGESSAADTTAAPSIVASLAQVPKSKPPADLSEYKSVDFADLADFECPTYVVEGSPPAIPEKIRALSGKSVAVDGYMMPLVYEKGGAKKFLLLKNQFGCCAGVAPKVNEWIEVTMQGDSRADYISHVLVTVWGELEVKSETRSGASVGLYKMKGVRSEFTQAK